MKKVLITGATGFIGHHLARLLSDAGVLICALVRDPARLGDLQVEPIIGDITNPQTLKIPSDVDTVFHLAGVTKARNRAGYFAVNSTGTKNMVEAVERQAPAAHFVYTSSLAATGPSRELESPVTEADTPHPVSSYGESKLEGEQWLHRSSLSYTIVRPPAVFGERERDVFAFFKMANSGFALFPGFSERWFSLVYGPDLCQAMVALAEQKRGDRTVYFVAYPEVFSWSAFTAAAAAGLGKRVRIIRLPLPLVYPIAIVQELGSFVTRKPALLNWEKCRELTEKYWTCDVQKMTAAGITMETPFPNALENTVQWYRNNNWL